MSEWLSWAKQPFQSAADTEHKESCNQRPPAPSAQKASGKEEKEEKADPPSSKTPPAPAASWLPALPLSLPSLSLPSFLSSSSSSSTVSSAPSSADPATPPPYPLPSISSSPSTNRTVPVVEPPPADVSYLRSLLSSFTSTSSSSPPQPTTGVTPSGLRWEKMDGVQGFALSMPADDESKEQAAQHLISDEELTHVKQICQQLQQQHSSTSPATSAASSLSPSSSSGASSNSAAASPSSAELHTHTRGAVVVNNTNEATATSNEHEVAILDLDNVDWWTLVDPTRDKEAAAEYNIEEGYVVVRHEDTVDAMAVYLAQVLVNHPHASRLTAQQLAAIIDKSLRPLEPRRYWPGGRYITYGYYAYLAYSWTATAYSLYRRPWMIKLVATGAVQAASWLLVLFV